jgi:flagellar capping protein FliD
MVDGTQLALSLLAVIGPVGVAGLGWSWRTAKKSGSLNQKVQDLEKDYNGFKQDVSSKLESMSARLEKVDVNVATTQNDVLWIKKALQNHGMNG